MVVGSSEVDAGVDVEEELRGMTLGQEVNEEDSGDDEIEATTPGGTRKKNKSLVKGMGKGIKNLWKSTFSGKDDPVAERINKALKECRHPMAHKSGGLINDDLEGIKMSRSVVAEIVKLVGKKLLQGENLMKVTFPVRCCQPRTILECAAYQFVFCPHYLSAAARCSDPVERMKQVVCCFVACLHTTSQFVKPFNPTLGETLQATFAGGTNLYLEQTSHHPPVTSWYLEGPESEWKYYGWSTYEASFGYNKLYVKQSGARLCEFSDGTVIDVNFSMDRYNNVYWGDLIQEMLGTYVFRDSKAGVQCTVVLNGVKGAPSDVIIGSIERLGQDGLPVDGDPVCTLEGSWLGFLDFGGIRYWDYKAPTRCDPVLKDQPLPSDSRFRRDRNALAQKNMDLAQKEKTEIEERQRKERRLRAAAAKARENGGTWSAVDVK